MITNKLKSSKENKINKIMKSPLLAKIKFEPTFFPVLWQFAFPLPLFGEAGGRGVRGEFRPPSPLIKSVWIFSNTHRHESRGGESGIRTHGTGNPAQRLSRPPPSTTRPSLRMLYMLSTNEFNFIKVPPTHSNKHPT